jgi:hypothetical protein
MVAFVTFTLFRSLIPWYRDDRSIMTYGVFNLSSGNLIDSVDTEPEALELLSSLLEEKDTDPEMIGLLVADDRGRTIANLHGHTLTDAVYHGGIHAGVYA